MSGIDPDLQPPRIRRLAEQLQRANLPAIATSIDDDDCAVLDTHGRAVVVTTDFINSNPISATFKIGSALDLGWLSVANNVSDLLGSGARPLAYLSSVILQYGTPESEFDEIMRGVLEGCNDFGIRLCAGDTKLGRSRAIGGTAIGTTSDVDAALRRDRALVGHDVWLTGPIGGVAAGLVLLNSQRPVRPKDRKHAFDSIRRPDLPLDRMLGLVDSRIAAAGTDVSDGLIADLHSMCRSSGIGAEIEVTTVPLDRLAPVAASELHVSDFALAASIGGDLQSVFTSDRAMRRTMSDLGFFRIGKMIDQPGVFLKEDNHAPRGVGFTGHRDARQLQFFQEVQLIAKEIDGSG